MLSCRRLADSRSTPPLVSPISLFPLPAALSPHTYAGKDARFGANKAELFGLVRERYLLLVKCLESAPGKEPQHPYLYPQPAIAAAHH